MSTFLWLLATKRQHSLAIGTRDKETGFWGERAHHFTFREQWPQKGLELEGATENMNKDWFRKPIKVQRKWDYRSDDTAEKWGLAFCWAHFVLHWNFHLTKAVSFKIFPHSLSLTRIWWFILLHKLSILEKLKTHKQLQKWYREVPWVLNQLPPRVTPYKVNSLHRTLSKPGSHTGSRRSARL